MEISLCDPVLGENEKNALCSVIDSRWLTMGDRVASFENAFAHLHDVEHAVAVNSCTAGLHLALLALDISAGDEVLVPSLTFVATVNAVLYVGAKPVFVDVAALDRPHISLEDAKIKCTNKTKAIIVMHYGGYLVDTFKWRNFAERNGLFIIEDAAHAPGTGDVGRWSDISVYSFFSNKNMTTGEGGMVISRRGILIDRIKRMRSHGMTTLTLERHRGHAHSYDVTMLGYNYRMDELRAAIGLIQLERLAQWNDRRRDLTLLYRQQLADSFPDCTVPFGNDHKTAAHLMPILLPDGVDRNIVMNKLRDSGIQTSIHYPPAHRFEYYRNLFPDTHLPTTESFADRELSLPLHPSLSKSKIIYIVKKLSQCI